MTSDFLEEVENLVDELKELSKENKKYRSRII